MGDGDEATVPVQQQQQQHVIADTQYTMPFSHAPPHPSTASQFSHSTAPTGKVSLVQLGVLSPEEARMMSVCEITSDVSYEKGFPRPGGLSDPLMGTMDKDLLCRSCGGDQKECAGHFGHLELAQPVFHPGLMNTTLRVLRSVCFSCSRLKCSRTTAKFAHAKKLKRPEMRLRYTSDLCRTAQKCSFDDGDDATATGGGCGASQPSLKFVDQKLVAEWKPQANNDDETGSSGALKQTISPARARDILMAISDDDCIALGLDPKWSRPEWFIVSVLPIPPLAVRPSVSMDGGSGGRSEDDLTHKLVEIVRASNALRKHQDGGAPAHMLEDFAELLQFHVSTYMINDMAGQNPALTRTGRPIKSISQRLKSKEGRIRGNLMGKRVDFSARSVITPDPNLALDELGVPGTIALNLTVPEIVTPYNYERLKELVENGPNPLPGKTGAKYIVDTEGHRIDLRYLKQSGDRHLEYGMVVERHMMNGDVVLFNRQPSLHKMSIMGHRVRIFPYSTFRMNLSVTPPYNADFDGDEMNMHLPQSFETKAEIEHMMTTDKMIVSPQANKPVMGIVQDTLLGCRIMTKRDTFLEKDLFMNVCMWHRNWDGKIPMPTILKPKPLWTGKQVFNLFLPNINLTRKSNWYADGEPKDFSPTDSQVIVESGELITGTFDKKSLGASAGSVIHVTWEECGPTATKDFIGSTQWLVNSWLLQRSFSIGIGDTVADQDTMMAINETIAKAKSDVKVLIEKWQTKSLEQQPGRTVQETFEDEVNKVLNSATNKAGKSAQLSLPDDNNVKRMVTAGSKGSPINIAQMIACVGQQNVEGKRIPYGFVGRTLPHFVKDDYGPESRGFVENSYLRGLTPQEFFFHAMGGREGLIDTAVKTASTGYIQRRLVKAMEDVRVQYDGTARNGNGDIIQFLYGEDGMAAEYIETQSLDHLKWNEKKFSQVYMWGHGDDEDEKPDCVDDDTWQSMMTDPEIQKKMQEEVDQLKRDLKDLRCDIIPSGDTSWPLPLNVSRLITNAQRMFQVSGGAGTSYLTPMGIMDEIKKLTTSKLVVVVGDDLLSKEAQANSTILFSSLIRCKLASKRVLMEYGLTRQAFEWLMGEIEHRFLVSQAQPGEMIGCLAAQSVGEPATQMTLNTFHFAGVSAKNVTLGVPRLTEIINISKSIRTPSLTVYLKEPWSKTKESAKDVQCYLEFTTLKQVTSMTEIYYDPEITKTIVDEDKEWVEQYYELPDEEVDLNRISPWVLRIVLNRELMVDKKLDMGTIASRMESEFGGDLHLVFTDDNAEELVLRVRVVDDNSAELKGFGDDEGGDVADGGPDEGGGGGGGGESGGGGTGGGGGQQSTRSSVVAVDDDAADFLKRVESSLMDMPLRGVQNIKKVFLRQTKKVVNTVDGYHNEDEWMLDTEGVNMAEVMCDERIDFSRCLTNDLVETLQLFGIEATRAALLRELRGVIEFDGSYVNYRHLSILCDVMTCRGYLMAITRHGINRVENGPLMRCSFEETVDILFEASAHGMTDRMRGVSGPIMMGQLAPVGTGSFDLVLDEEKLERAMDMDGGAGGGGGGLLMKEQHPMTPSMMTPMHSSPFAVMSPGQQGGLFSPFAGGGGMSPSSQAMFSPFGGHQADGNAAIFSPSHSMMSPASFSPGGGGVSPGYSPTSPAYSPTQDSCFATLCFVCHARINATDSRKTPNPNPKPQTPNHFTGVPHSTDFAFTASVCLMPVCQNQGTHTRKSKPSLARQPRQRKFIVSLLASLAPG